MATVRRGERSWILQTADTCYLGNPSDAAVGTYAIMLVSNSFVGSITVKALSGAPEAQSGVLNGGTPETPLAVQYSARYLNGAIASDTLVSTAITGTSLILVPCSGQTVVLDCTSYTSGSMRVYQIPLLGAAV